MAKFEVDLTNCDKEPIHILGRIQSHGFLMGVDSSTHLVNFISENAGLFIDEDAGNCLGKHIDDIQARMPVRDHGQRPKLSQVLAVCSEGGAGAVNSFYREFDGRPYHLIVRNAGPVYLLEFEPSEMGEGFDIQKTIGHAISEILAESSISSLLDAAARQVKKLIQYDRVMIYRFSEDGHGEVVAEEKNDGLEPFLGLHYPASDIPKQARELYKINLTRIIADVHTDCPAILSHQPEDAPLDLTHAVLRAVSPIHIQYLKNMGVASSFSISLLSHGELWGLVACHNYSPKFVDYKLRDASKLIGQIISPALEYRLGEEDSDKFILINQSVNTLVQYTERESDMVKALTANSVTINDICSATGTTLVFDNTVTSIGSTPGDNEIRELVQWLMKNAKDMVFHTDRLPTIFSPAGKYSHVGSGLFACILSRELSEVILFFKAEQEQTVHWAGNPEKAVEVAGDGSLQLSPRKSFDSWKQIVKHCSGAWSRAEIAALINLREQVSYQIGRKANEIRRLNESLKQAYEELDTFSVTVSHDLRTPLSSIKGYAEILLLQNGNLDGNARRILERINACADKMTVLIKDILHYSSYSRDEIRFVKVDMARVIADNKADLETSQFPGNIEFVVGDTPDLYGDATMIGQVFSNLLGNAVKYSSRMDRPIVKVEGHVLDNETIYTVSDNGIGIDKAYHDRVYDLFRRMDNVKDFEGTGVGLAIVKRIVERHQGRIWFESEPGKGTFFHIMFRNEWRG